MFGEWARDTGLEMSGRHISSVLGELWLQLLRSKWLNQKNKLVGNPSHSYRRVITDVQESSDWVLHATGTQTVCKKW